MAWTSILAIYILVWIMCAFLLLPFGVQTAEEAGVAKVPGQADSAPANFRPRRLVIRATVIAAVLTTLWVLNYERGWITAQDINVFPEPPASAQRLPG
jgi:predicted secreted protein